VTWVVQAPDRDLSADEKKLFTRVRRTLWDYEPLRASHAEISVQVAGQSVRLTGRVRTLPQRTMAGLLAQRLNGVDRVDNELVADPVVIREVADALARDARTAPYVLLVDVRHGVVTLRGSVPDEQTRGAALAIASRVPSVAAVRSSLELGSVTFPPVALQAEESDTAPQPALAAAPAAP
jgi:osmotically-inducible protein OsmY